MIRGGEETTPPILNIGATEIDRAIVYEGCTETNVNVVTTFFKKLLFPYFVLILNTCRATFSKYKVHFNAVPISESSAYTIMLNST